MDFYGIQVELQMDFEWKSSGNLMLFKCFSSGNLWISSGIQVFFKWKHMEFKWRTSETFEWFQMEFKWFSTSNGFQVETYGFQVEFKCFSSGNLWISSGIQVVFKWISSGVEKSDFLWCQEYLKWKVMNSNSEWRDV